MIFDEYAKVPGGHVRPEDRASLKGVIGVPIWWRGHIIGSCVIFSRDPERTFSAEDAELLELFAKHAAIAITNARLHEAAEANARAEAVTAERNRMAREVHDTVAQGLVSILLQLRAADGALQGGRDEDARSALEAARAAAEAAFEETRRSVLGLAPSPLEGRSLEEALELELGWANKTGLADVRLMTAGTPVPLPPDLAHMLFRVAQEALTNALRHAEARSVRVGVVYTTNDVTLLVQDDGAGFDRARMEQDGLVHGLGVKGMTERARLLGGTLELDSTPGWGTRVRVSIPLPSASAKETSDRSVAGPGGGRSRGDAGGDLAAPARGPSRPCTSWARRDRARRPSRPGEPFGPTSCSWTCRCPAATARRRSPGSGRRIRTPASWR